MSVTDRIETALHRSLLQATSETTPPSLREAMTHAVFPGGARLRPGLAVSVAAACGDRNPLLTDASAAAIEIMHCASLVHDDLPSFDDAATRRGQPTVHARFGVPAAVLAGDALIAVAFEILATPRGRSEADIPRMIQTLARCIGPARGIIAGQAWELESETDIRTYHELKTGALFEAAAMLGALSSASDPSGWRAFGTGLGTAYQIVDDVLDAAGTERALGKPVGQDQLHGRPSVVTEVGVSGALDRLQSLFSELPSLIPECPRPDYIHAWLDRVGERLFPPLQNQAAAAMREEMTG